MGRIFVERWLDKLGMARGVGSQPRRGYGHTMATFLEEYDAEENRGDRDPPLDRRAALRQSSQPPDRCLCIFKNIISDSQDQWSVLLDKADADKLRDLLASCLIGIIHRESAHIQNINILRLENKSDVVAFNQFDCQGSFFASASSGNQWHFWFDVVSVLWAEYQALGDNEAWRTNGVLLLTGNAKKLEIYQLFGNTVVDASKFWALKQPKCFARVVMGADFTPDKTPASFRAMIDLLHERLNTSSISREKEILLLQRGGSRSFVNVEDFAEKLQANLSSRNWTVRIADFSGMNQTQQARAVRKASVMIGMHGAGLANFLWMHPSSLVVEVDSYRIIESWGGWDCFQSLANLQSPGIHLFTWKNNNISRLFPKELRTKVVAVQNESASVNRALFMHALNLELDASEFLAYLHTLDKFQDLDSLISTA
eukprot:g10379.t1